MKKIALLMAMGMASQMQGQTPSTAWERTFDGAGSAFDEVKYVRTDNSGNVYVTGRSNGGATATDVVTRKYDASGSLLWSHAYNNADYNRADEPFDMELTSTGDAVVVGRTRTSGGFQPSSMGFILMLDGATGNQVWLDSIKGPGFSGSNFSFLRKVAISSTDDIFVTGNYTGANSYMMVAAKYGVNGSQQWMQPFDNSTDPSFHENAGADVAVAGDGSVYVAGFTKLLTSGENFAVWRLSPATGDQVSFSAKAGPVNNVFTSGLRSIVIDAGGNAYVYGTHSGERHRVVKYDTDLAELWTYDFDTSAVGFTASYTGADNHLELDNSGNLILATCFGSSPGTWAGLVKFSPDGTVLWYRAFSGTSANNNEVYGVVTDGGDNIYFTGTTSNPGFDAATYKLDPDGNVLWSVSRDGASSGNDKGHSIALGDDGSVYVGGLITDLTNGDYYLVKYLDLSVSADSPSLTESNLRVHPNPASDLLRISGLTGSALAEVTDMSGRVVMTALPDDRHSIAIGHLASGSYLLRVIPQYGQAVVLRFVRE